MTTLTKLQEKRGELMAQARDALDEITKNTDENRSKELEERHDKIMTEFDVIGKNIEREERMAKIEKDAAEQRERDRPIKDVLDKPAVDDDNPLSYRSVFYSYLARGADIGELSAEERAVLRGGVQNEASLEKRAQTTTGGSGTAGGYTVPIELAAIIIKAMAAYGPMYDENVCTEWKTTSGNQIVIPTIDDTAVTAEKHTEAAALTDDGGKDVTFGKKTLDAYVYDTEFLRISMELAQDSIFNMENLIGGLLGERLGRIANRELTIGDGVDDPNGIVTASSLGVTTASATALTADEIIDLIHSVDPAYRTGPKVGFMFNDNLLKLLRKLKDGDGNYLWQMGNVQQGVPGTLLGYRYHINQAIASVPTVAAATRVAIFGDMGKYFVRKVGSPVIGVLKERFWPDLGMAGLIRLDGELSDTAAVKHLITKAS